MTNANFMKLLAAIQREQVKQTSGQSTPAPVGRIKITRAHRLALNPDIATAEEHAQIARCAHCAKLIEQARAAAWHPTLWSLVRWLAGAAEGEDAELLRRHIEDGSCRHCHRLTRSTVVRWLADALRTGTHGADQIRAAADATVGMLVSLPGSGVLANGATPSHLTQEGSSLDVSMRNTSTGELAVWVSTKGARPRWQDPDGGVARREPDAARRADAPLARGCRLCRVSRLWAVRRGGGESRGRRRCPGRVERWPRPGFVALNGGFARQTGLSDDFPENVRHKLSIDFSAGISAGVCYNNAGHKKGPNMSPILQTLGIDQMSRDQRIVLVQEIWESIAAESTPPLLTASQRSELRQRVAEDDANPDDTVPWEQVEAQTLARLKS